MRSFRRSFAVLALALSAGLAVPAWAQVHAAAPDRQAVDLASGLWTTARQGDERAFEELLKRYAADPQPGLRAAAAALKANIAARETARATRQTEVRADLDKALAAPADDFQLTKALRAAIELQELALLKDTVLGEPRVQELIQRCETAARAAEARGDALTAGELFVLLDVLVEIKGTYRPDVRRIGLRQEMLRLYVPERLWQLRADRQRARGEKDLPPYNAFGGDWKARLSGVDQSLVEKAVNYARAYVERVPTSELMTGGLEGVRTLVSTADLASAFPGLGDEQARRGMLAAIEQESVALVGNPDSTQIGQMLDRLRRRNDQTVKLPAQALLHEFGNGMMSRLDPFSEIIWPDEVSRFLKSTQGNFPGVGIQIELAEDQNIRVVTPIEGTPAQRAGIHAGDVLSKVNGNSIFGLSLDQAVEVITGPAGTTVTLTVERPVEPPEGVAADAKDETETIEFVLKRSMINVVTVKGWKRDGVREDAWDWFIDPEDKIGYIRLTQFANTTGAELDRAIREMRKTGLNGLVLDLRFNPGGLLDQAVRVSRRFIDAEGGVIVATKGPSGLVEPQFTEPGQATLAKVPVVVLINEGSASASEIVAGAMSTYAHEGKLDAVVLGARSFGKGSVQNVWHVTPTAMMKVTTAYYTLPDRSIIHRRPGNETWGVEPDLRVEMLPKQNIDAIMLRRNADVMAVDEKGAAMGKNAPPNPDDLITKGTDLQLETALLLLRGKSAVQVAQQARVDKVP